MERKIPRVFHKSDGKQTLKTHTVMRAKYLPRAMNQNNYSRMKNTTAPISMIETCTALAGSLSDETFSMFQ